MPPEKAADRFTSLFTKNSSIPSPHERKPREAGSKIERDLTINVFLSNFIFIISP
jgi:hypothetical protein